MDRHEEIENEEALDHWQKEYDEGRDLSAQALCPAWPKERLKVLQQKIDCRRRILSMVEDDGVLEENETIFSPGYNVPKTTYILEEFKGRGAFGEVWKAKTSDTDQVHVLKFCLTKVGIKTLKKEAKLLSQIQSECNHEGFVKLIQARYDCFPQFIAYEYVREGNLAQYMERFRTKRPFSPLEATEIILYLAETMKIAHELPNTIVHRDLKPQNILISSSNCMPPKLKIADFGLGGMLATASAEAAKANGDQSISIAGYTPFYASFEQFTDCRRKIPSDDVHALGVIWYELLIPQLFTNLDDNNQFWRKKLPLWRKNSIHELMMTDTQMDFLESCLGTEEHRPPNAGEMAEGIRKHFKELLQLRQEIAKDITEITIRRNTHENWRKYIKQAFEKRYSIWVEAAKQQISEAYWFVGLCWDMGLVDYSTTINLSTSSVGFHYVRELVENKENRYDLAADNFQRAAEGGFMEGCGEAQYYLACYHRFGIGNREQKESDVLYWLEKAAAAGHSDALFELATHYLKLSERPKGWDVPKITKCIIKAAEHGSRRALEWLFNGRIKSPDSISYLRKSAAEQGSPEAQVQFGRDLESGAGLSRMRLYGEEYYPSADKNADRNRIDYTAIQWYAKAAQAGSPEAMFLLAEYLIKILGVNLSDIAEQYFGEKDSLLDYDKLYQLFKYEPKLIVQRNELAKWYMIAASRGFPDAQFRLWELIVSVPKESFKAKQACFPECFDEVEAVKWLCKAAAQGHKEAIEYLTTQYGVNHILISQCPLIIDTMTLLAEKGNNKAAFQLAVIFSQGDLFIRSYSKSRKWLWRAAELGHPDAARMILDGHDLPEDDLAEDEDMKCRYRQRAVELEKEHKDWAAFYVYEGLAEKEDVESQYRLAESLYYGRGCKVDTVHAVQLYQTAACKGYAEARKRLAEMGPSATMDYIEYYRRCTNSKTESTNPLKLP
jgi:TPR repeat protein